MRISMGLFWCDCSHYVFIQIRLKEIFETEMEIFLILELVTGGELFDRYDVLHKWKAIQMWDRISDIHHRLKIVHSKKWEFCHHILTFILLQNCMAFFLFQKEDILKNVLFFLPVQWKSVRFETTLKKQLSLYRKRKHLSVLQGYFIIFYYFFNISNI